MNIPPMGAQKTKIHVLELGSMENFIYLIEDIQSKQAAVVDPAWDAPAILALAKQHKLSITDILLTHSHHDHINAIGGVLNIFDAQLHLCKAEAQFWGQDDGQSDYKLSTHHGGDTLKIGKTQIEILHTPGHTPGSACYRIDKQLITGDTLFVFGCGRCDLDGGDPNEMFKTLNQLKNKLPKDMHIFPGHNYAVKPSITMQEQITGNPFMHFSQAEDFVHFRMHQHGKVRSSPYDAVSVKCAHEWLT